MTKILNLVIKTEQVFETKWGFVAYSFEDYKKLKRLNVIFQKARQQAARWGRWVRKLPHNRIEKKWLRNKSNQKIGFEIVGPLTEPVTCDLFSTKKVNIDRSPVGAWFDGDYIVTNNKIELEYQKSRSPKESADMVEEAGMSVTEINELLAKAEIWR